MKKIKNLLLTLLIVLLVGCGNDPETIATSLPSSNTLVETVVPSSESTVTTEGNNSDEINTKMYDFNNLHTYFGTDYVDKTIKVNGNFIRFDSTHYDPKHTVPVLNAIITFESYVEFVYDLSVDITSVKYSISEYSANEYNNSADYFVGLEYYKNGVWAPAEEGQDIFALEEKTVTITATNVKRVRLAFLFQPNQNFTNARFLLNFIEVTGTGVFNDDVSSRYILEPTELDDYLEHGFVLSGETASVIPGINFKGTGASLLTLPLALSEGPVNVILSMKLNGGTADNIADGNIFSVEGYDGANNLVQKVDKTGLRNAGFEEIIFSFTSPIITRYKLIYTHKNTEGYKTGGNYQVQTMTIERV